MSFNELLKEAGDFGLYQKLLCFGFLFSSITIVGFTYWSNVFMLLAAPHRCRLSPNDTWESNISQYNNIVVGECDIHFNGTWNESLFGSKEFNSTVQQTVESGNSTEKVISCPYGWVYDFSVLYPTISTEQDWVCENSSKMYAVYSWYWVGAICGYALFGTVSDRYGRKRSYQASLLLSLVADASAIFMNSHIAFSIARFFSAMGQGNIPTLAFMLVIEYVGPKKRRFVFAVWCLTWTSMSAFVPVVPYFLRYWRWVLCSCTVPCAFVLMLSCFVPESASWLIIRGRLDEAAELIQHVSIVNGRKMDIEYIKRKLETQDDQGVQLKPTVDLKGSATNGQKEKSEEKKERTLTTRQAIFGLVKTPNMRKKTIFLVFAWMIACICYNGNSIEASNLPFNLYLSYSIGAIMELPSNLFCLFVMDRIGRRWASFGFLFVSGILGIISGLLRTGTHVVLVLAMVMRSGFAAGFDIVFTFSSESFPTEVRGRGIAIIRCFGGIGSAFAPFIVSLAEYDPLLPLVGFGILSVFAAGITLFVPETARQHLPHTLEEGEEFGKEQSFFFCPFIQEKFLINLVFSSFPLPECWFFTMLFGVGHARSRSISTGNLRPIEEGKGDDLSRDNPALEATQ